METRPSPWGSRFSKNQACHRSMASTKSSTRSSTSSGSAQRWYKRRRTNPATGGWVMPLVGTARPVDQNVRAWKIAIVWFVKDNVREPCRLTTGVRTVFQFHARRDLHPSTSSQRCQATVPVPLERIQAFGRDRVASFTVIFWRISAASSRSSVGFRASAIISFQIEASGN